MLIKFRELLLKTKKQSNYIKKNGRETLVES